MITDCNAITSLIDTRTPTRHLLRWSLAIQEYKSHIPITHTPGKLHHNADALSRMAFLNTPDNPARQAENNTLGLYGGVGSM